MGIPFYLHEDVFIPLFVGKLINLTMKIHVTPMNSLLQYPIMSGILSNGSFCSMTYKKGENVSYTQWVPQNVTTDCVMNYA